MSTIPSVDERASLFVDPTRWADMDRWHDEVAAIRRDEPVLRAEVDGYEPFLVLTRHRDVFEVSRNNELWLNTARSVLGADADWERMMTSGMPPATLVHLDGLAPRRDGEI